MDTVISRMMQILGVVLVLGMVVSGIETATAKDWGATVAYLLFAVVSAGVFTLIWIEASTNMATLLGSSGKRSQVTEKSVVGLSVGLLALFTCVGFVVAGLAATMSGDNFWARWFYGLGSGSTAALCIIWGASEHAFVKKLKEKSQ